MTHIIFQQAAGSDGSSPWSVLFLGGEVIYGRPDATALIGFSPERNPMAQASRMTPASLVKDPEELVGQYPIFTDAGHMFSDVRPIISAKVWEGDASGAQRLRESQAEHRRDLEKSGAVASTWTVIYTDGIVPDEQWIVAALRGHHQPELNSDSHVVYVQSLNGTDAMERAREQIEADAESEFARDGS